MISNQTEEDISENNIIENPVSKTWFFFIICYLVIDYGRPQDIVPALGYLRPNLWVTIILTIFVLKNMFLVKFQIPQIKLIWLFIFILTLLSLFANNHHLAFNAACSLFMYMPFIISCAIGINTIDRIKKILQVIICLMIFQAVYSIFNQGHGTGNFLWDENDLALFLCTWIPFSLAMFFSARKKLGKIVYGISIVVALCGIVVSFSRGGFLGFLLMIIIFWIFSTKKLITLVIFILVGFSFYLLAGDSYWKEMSTSTDSQDGTGKERIESWKSGLVMFKHNPLGVGGNNFPVRFSEYQTSYFQHSMWGRVAHSIWFTLIPETGIQGILIYFLLIYFNLKTILNIRKGANYLPLDNTILIKNLSVAFVGSFAGFFGAASFLAVLYYPHFWYLTGITVATDNIMKKDNACL